MYGVLVVTDKAKYHNEKAIFLHKSTSMEDILIYNKDINSYFSFNTIQETRAWFSQWYAFNKCNIPLENFEVIEILPGINTLGYIPKEQPSNNLYY